jgi:hypothetical protein
VIALPPLLALSQGRKVQARRAPVVRPKEIKLQVDVANLLRAHCLQGWRWTYINRKAKDAREGAIFKKMGLAPGWPDFELISPLGLPHFLELKRLGEEIEDGSDQDDFRMWCVVHGIPHCVAWTIDHVLAAFESWRCLRVYRNDRSHPA